MTEGERISSQEESHIRRYYRDLFRPITDVGSLNDVLSEAIAQIRATANDRLSAAKKQAYEHRILEVAREKKIDLNEQVVQRERVGKLQTIKNVYENYVRARQAGMAPHSPQLQTLFERRGGFYDQLRNPLGENWTDPRGVEDLFEAVYRAEAALQNIVSRGGIRNHQEVEEFADLVEDAQELEKRAGGTRVTTTRALMINLEQALSQLQEGYRFDFTGDQIENLLQPKGQEAWVKINSLNNRLKNIWDDEPSEALRNNYIRVLKRQKDEYLHAQDVLNEEVLDIRDRNLRRRVLEYVNMVMREYLGFIGEALENPFNENNNNKPFSEKTAYSIYDWAYTELTYDHVEFISDLFSRVAAVYDRRDNGLDEDDIEVLELARKRGTESLAALYTANLEEVRNGRQLDLYYEKRQYLDLIVNRANYLLDNQREFIISSDRPRSLNPETDPDWKYPEWKNYYETALSEARPDLYEFFQGQADVVIEALRNSFARSIQRSDKGGAQNDIYPRYSALRDALATSPNPDYQYLSTYLEKRRVLWDIELDYGRSRSLTSDLDGMAAEAGFGFSIADVVDWFWLPYKTVADPDDARRTSVIERAEGENFKFHEEVSWGLALVEDLLTTPNGQFAGNNFKETNRSKLELKEEISRRLQEEFPNVPEKNNKEIVDIIYDIAEISGVRFYSFGGKEFACGGSPAGNVAKFIDYITQTMTTAADLYKAYKREPFNPAEILNIRSWLRFQRSQPENRSKGSQNRLDNIEDMAIGQELLLDSVAPLRERHEIHMEGPHHNVVTAYYPTGWHLFYKRAQERLKKDITIENWVEGRPKAMDLEHYLRGPVESAKGYANNREGRIEYRNKLNQSLHDLFNSKISGLKTNMMVDWDEVGLWTVSYIDKLFRAYAQLDQGVIGSALLYQRFKEEIKNSVGNLSSAGKITERDSHGHPIHNRDGTVKTIDFSDYVLREIAWRKKGNAARRRPAISSIDVVPPQGIAEYRPLPWFRYWLFRNKRRNADFHKKTGLLGQGVEKQKEVPKEAGGH